ncbi:ATP-dependent helicase [Bifidobacterium biavatii]|uniref:DNA 3'-5' helicase n=1 Tax=Bifidobacterium biavatii DSM 23969 TaxID=1437608 RepID=A0A086ZWG1_9BIFI|nr:ATP-dependent helicase [Bifidobacterium biavatii]KFI50861.1 DNA helicase II [Bifidobacterium biavatii DSM 23969]
MATSAASAEHILDGLDEAQRRAATTLHGPVRIIAGAGAGKTRTVTRRIAYACARGEWDPAGVLAVTFSVKAAAEMRTRIAGLGVGDTVTAATFHSAALRQVRNAWEDICDAPMPRIAGEPGELQRIVAQAMQRSQDGIEADSLAVRDVQAEINWCKISLVAPDDYLRVTAATHRQPPAGLSPQQFADAYDCYEQEKTSHGLIDFDDILLIDCHILDDFDEIAADIRRNLRWITVDEYQDVSPLQHRLLTLWLGERNRNICVVGDPAQTIYSFAGASSYDLLAFPDQFGPLAADVSLNTDYRSTPQVVRYANQVLAKSPDRTDYLKLVSAREPGARIERTRYVSDEDEAKGVVSRIMRLVARGVSPSDCAILTRINAQQNVFCTALREAGLRYRVRRDSGWEGTALVDEHAVERQMLVDAMQARADESRVGEVRVTEARAGDSADGMREASRADDAAAVRGAGAAAGAGVAGVDAANAAHDDAPTADGKTGKTATGEDRAAAARLAAKTGAVTISTIHASKGLEFKHVFLIGCSEGLIPFGSPNAGDELEEERRLMYVAVTRAEDTLHLSYAVTKNGDVGSRPRVPSRFVA